MVNSRLDLGFLFCEGGQLVGFTELGSLNDEFKIFERNIKEDMASEDCHDFATHVILFMVRGIFSNLAYPFSYFAGNGFTADQLYPCVIEATKVLEYLGFKVRAFTADGASANRKFFKMVAEDVHENFFWTHDPFDKARKIYFISDVPHLLKTSRNCLENSHGKNNTRHFHISFIAIIE